MGNKKEFEMVSSCSSMAFLFVLIHTFKNVMMFIMFIMFIMSMIKLGSGGQGEGTA